FISCSATLRSTRGKPRTSATLAITASAAVAYFARTASTTGRACADVSRPTQMRTVGAPISSTLILRPWPMAWSVTEGARVDVSCCVITGGFLAPVPVGGYSARSMRAALACDDGVFEMSERPFSIQPVTLEGRYVRLEPLSRDHLDGIVAAGSFEEIWRWLSVRPVGREGFEGWMDAALSARDAGTELPFTTIDVASGEIVGATRYLNIAAESRRLEIGWT